MALLYAPPKVPTQAVPGDRHYSNIETTQRLCDLIPSFIVPSHTTIAGTGSIQRALMRDRYTIYSTLPWFHSVAETHRVSWGKKHLPFARWAAAVGNSSLRSAVLLATVAC